MTRGSKYEIIYCHSKKIFSTHLRYAPNGLLAINIFLHDNVVL